MTLQELHEKDVIQIKSGENLGRIDDLAFENSQIVQVILHGRSRLFGLLGRDDDLVIPWLAIKTIGTDVVMVDTEIPQPHASRSKHSWL